ncbi:hypothetical protein A0H76_1058 [Hepatospora eriocheir]|uniref:Uncharacterized protein n=1 Tax=Hepatospora eriocheir TaxID=1081669 RepID=A0A1X0QHQ2_9MICR|nr:hypothetical protein A0H76_1058 [Hepatospora eriocheir]
MFIKLFVALWGFILNIIENIISLVNFLVFSLNLFMNVLIYIKYDISHVMNYIVLYRNNLINIMYLNGLSLFGSIITITRSIKNESLVPIYQLINTFIALGSLFFAYNYKFIINLAKSERLLRKSQESYIKKNKESIKLVNKLTDEYNKEKNKASDLETVISTLKIELIDSEHNKRAYAKLKDKYERLLKQSYRDKTLN